MSDDEATVEAVKDDDKEDYNDEDNSEVHPQPQPILPPHHTLCDKPAAASLLDTAVPKSHLRVTPPIIQDIPDPNPHPLPPNVSVQHRQPCLYSLQYQHPPDIIAPEPLPLSPNIST
jgi:hypothetical protein